MSTHLLEAAAARTMREDPPRRNDLRIIARVTSNPASQAMGVGAIVVMRGESEHEIWASEAREWARLLETEITPDMRSRAEKRLAKNLAKWTAGDENGPPRDPRTFPGSIEAELTRELDNGRSPLPFTKLEFLVDGKPHSFDLESGKFLPLVDEDEGDAPVPSRLPPIGEMNAATAIAAIGRFVDVEQLLELYEVETAGKKRPTVLAAIEKREAELKS